MSKKNLDVKFNKNIHLMSSDSEARLVLTLLNLLHL